MKFALVDGVRQEAKPGLVGACIGCGKPMIAKCGEVRVHHWAHKENYRCDTWHENKTEWHRSWQDQFPVEWQEVIFRTQDEWHVADVKTARGWVIEFQHSYLEPAERRARDAFYKDVAWVVDAKRRERDEKQFVNACDDGVPLSRNPPIKKVRSDECRLVQEWVGSNAFFDFGVDKPLWWLIAGKLEDWSYVTEVPRATFIETFRAETQTVPDFRQVVHNFRQWVAQYEQQRHAQTLIRNSPPLSGFEQYLMRQRARRHRRL